MGWDAERAEDEYQELRSRGLTDSQIIAMDRDDRQETDVEETTAQKRSRLRNAIEEAMAELRRMDRPEEPPLSEDHSFTVISLQFRYRNTDRVYAVAAIRGELGRWYATGAHIPGNGTTWSGLMEWIEERGELVGPIMVATQWSPIESPAS